MAKPQPTAIHPPGGMAAGYQAPQFAPLVFSAERESATTKRFHLWLFRIELVGLLGAVGISVGDVHWPAAEGTPPYLALGSAALVLLAFTASFLDRGLQFQARWYSARALAEALKSESWRFVMHNGSYAGPQASAEFGTIVGRLTHTPLVKPSRTLIEQAQALPTNTEEMQRSRGLGLRERLALYRAARIEEQQRWYAGGGVTNHRDEIGWYGLGLALQIIAFAYAVWAILGGASIHMVTLAATAATSAVAWATAKDYGFHAQSYENISSELLRLLHESRTLGSEHELDELVDNVENLISREHTIWVARRK